MLVVNGPLTYRSLHAYKYQVMAPFELRVAVYPKQPIMTNWISLTPHGMLSIVRGYAWDGATWTVDRASNMVASLAHDALYQLMRLGLLGQDWRVAVNCVYQDLVLAHGGWTWTANLEYLALDRLGSKYCAVGATVYEDGF